MSQLVTVAGQEWFSGLRPPHLGDGTVRTRTILAAAAVLAVGVLLGGLAPLVEPAARPAQDQAAQSDPLPSWNDGATKKAITDFVARVTAKDGPDYIPPATPRGASTARRY
jgi:hypothetical protein